MKTEAKLGVGRRALWAWLFPMCVFWAFLAVSWEGSSGPNDNYPRPHGLYIVAAVGAALINAWVLRANVRTIPGAIAIGAVVPGLIFAALFRV